MLNLLDYSIFASLQQKKNKSLASSTTLKALRQHQNGLYLKRPIIIEKKNISIF